MLSTRTRRITVPVAIVLALVAGPTLAGCSIQGIIKNATGGQVDVGGKGVPADFPRDVPLARGEVIYGAALASGKDKVWNVTIDLGGSNTISDITNQMKGAGFTNSSGLGGSTADGGTGVFENGKYGVLVVVGKTDNKWTANYTVTQKNEN